MDPTQISAAVIMVGTAAAAIVWLHSSQTAASARRMKGMMTRVGLDYGTDALAEPRTKAIVQQARRRCMRCACEDLCDRWLAGEVKGDNTFCPNRQIFRHLTETARLL